MKTAVITGASYGMGQAITQALLDEGWKVYGLSRSQPELTDDHFAWLRCDLSQQDQIEKCLTAIGEPVIDAFVSNAGVLALERATAVTPVSYNHTFSVNVLAPMLIVAALRDKIQHATIISVSSDSDRYADADYALYCASKAANTLYFDSLAQELKDAKVYVLLPDYVDTQMLREAIGDDKTFDWSATVRPSDVARLATDLLAGNVTAESGANIIVATEALKGAFEDDEKLYGYNTDTKALVPLVLPK